MKYTEITVGTTTSGSELVADILWEYSKQGVAISDAQDLIDLQRDKTLFWDYIDDGVENVGEVLVKGFVPAEESDNALAEIEGRLTELKNSIRDIPLGSLECITREIEGDEWKDIWKKHFRPIHTGSVVVCPEWISYDKKDGETVVLVDSSMAFGTGEHETTSMCIELLQKYIKKGDNVLDIGCGSGILGITAALLGAKDVVMTDIDQIAVSSAAHNARTNGVDEKCSVLLTDLIDSSVLKADLITANITADVLIRLSSFISGLTKKSAVVILSGIINAKVGDVEKAFTAAGLKLEKHINRGEWNSFVFKK